MKNNCENQISHKKKIISNEDYKLMTKKASGKSPVGIDCFKAFFTGGTICSIGQLLFFLYEYLGLEKKQAYAMVSVSLVFLASLLTGIGLYEKLAKHGGAGTLVPITGFSNALTSPALEFKAEGFIAGLGAKMFLIAGPVIVYGISASIIYGLIYYILRLFKGNF